MNKLTKEERAEVETIMENWLEWFNINRDGTITELLQIDKNKLIEWVEQKKKEWTEQAYEEGKEDADFNNHVERDLSLD